jgi:cation diffusion facilitator CzcD-associated flavoprotein CzcO/acetyl esterase/lipase
MTRAGDEAAESRLSPGLALLCRLSTRVVTAAAHRPSPLVRAAIDRLSGVVQPGHAHDAAVRELAIPRPGGPALRARLYEPDDLPAQPGLLVFFHGGGWLLGSVATHDRCCRFLARRARAKVLSVDYRLAPEHRFPAAVDDALAAFAYARTHARALGIDAARVAVGGDSAGGNLAAAVALHGDERPCFCLLLYPIVDADVDAYESARRFARGPLLARAALLDMVRHYAPTPADRRDPRCSVIDAPVPADLPPTFIAVAGVDPVRDQAERFAVRLRRHGVRVETQRFPALPHGFMSMLVDRRCRQAGETIARALGRALYGSRSPRVVVIGGGMSGLLMGIKLKRSGFEDFAIYEQADRIGGTWRDNTYPGLTCDVPSPLYAYSFEPNRDAQSWFPPGGDIRSYLDGVADRYGLRDHLRLGRRVAAARYEEGRWHVTVDRGPDDSCDFLVTATGYLNQPQLPDIEGLDRFGGPVFHSARWDHDVELAGKRVGILGTGSSGVQLVSGLAPSVARLLVFQRTAQWVFPVPNRRYGRVGRALRRSDRFTRLSYRACRFILERVAGDVLVRPGLALEVVRGICRLHLRRVRDPALRRRLTPTYEPGCKRMVMSWGFYKDVQRPNVRLISDSIARVEQRGIVTRDGTLHELDVLVLATGFDAHAYMRPLQLTGEGGRSLEDAWPDEPRSYRTVAVPGFPNLFTLVGPYSPIGNQPVTVASEVQADYVMRWIQMWAAGAVGRVVPTEAATDVFHDEVRRAAMGTVWASGCRSYYVNRRGTPELWPWSPARHRAMLQEPELAHFDVRSPQ